MINSPQTFENVTSLHCVLLNAKCVVEFTKIVTILQEKFSVLNEIIIIDLIDDEHSGTEDCKIPVIACRRLKFVTEHFTNFFSCAYHPHRTLESLHISTATNSKLKFNSEISNTIQHNCVSLIDLNLSGVTVIKNDTLLQETFQKCHALVVLNINNTNNGTLSSAKLHEIFCSMQGLVNLECLSISETVNVFGEDLLALHNLLYRGLPKLKDFYLSFQRLVVYFTLLGDAKFKSIQELLCTLLSGKQPSPDCHTVAFRWRDNQTIQAWLTGLRCNVTFQLLQ